MTIIGPGNNMLGMSTDGFEYVWSVQGAIKRDSFPAHVAGAVRP